MTCHAIMTCHLNSEGDANAVEAANSDFDPFAELDSEVNNIEDMARETSGTDAVSIRETSSGFFDPPICHELYQTIGKIQIEI